MNNIKDISLNNITEIINNNPTEEELNEAISVLVKNGIKTGSIKVENTASKDRDYLLVSKEDYDDWD